MLKDELELLYKNGELYRTVHKNRVVYIRKQRHDKLLAVETRNGTYYADEKYPTIDLKGDYKWIADVGSNKLYIDKMGKVIGLYQIGGEY